MFFEVFNTQTVVLEMEALIKWKRTCSLLFELYYSFFIFYDVLRKKNKEKRRPSKKVSFMYSTH